MKSNNEFEDITKMFNLLREDEGDETSIDPKAETFTLTKDNDFFQEQMAKMRELTKGAMLVFNPINVDYTLLNFEWSLIFNGNLELIIKVSNDDSGLLISSDNMKINKEIMAALYKLEGYFRTELLTAVTEKLDNKDF